MVYLLEYSDWVAQREQELNEDWGLGDWVHLGADVLSAVADSVVPGSGMILDLIHSISYWVQSGLTQNPVEKLSLDLQGVVTLGSVVAIGAFQTAAISFKLEIKAIIEAFKKGANPATISLAKKSATAAASHAQTILNLITSISKWVGSQLAKLKNSALGTWLIEHFGSFTAGVNKVLNFLAVQVPASIRQFLALLAKLNPAKIGAQAASGEASELALKQVAKTYAANKGASTAVNAIAQTTQKTNQQIAAVQQKKPAAQPIASAQPAKPVAKPIV
jgi:hypothetical protein